MATYNKKNISEFFVKNKENSNLEKDNIQKSVFNDLVFYKAKSTGANDAGIYGGIYKNKDGTLSMVKCEKNYSKNISEFLGSKIFEVLSPGSGAKVSIIAPNTLDEKLSNINGLQNDGSEVYVKSDYINNYSADMYVDMDSHMSDKNKPSKFFRKEGTLESLGRPLFAGTRRILDKAFKEIPYSNFDNIAPASLLIGDFDMHIGNIGVVRDTKNPDMKPKLVRIDFAGSLDKLENDIHPHSISRHLPLIGPTNHFREFPNSLKMNDNFANSLLAISELELDTVIENSFRELARYYDQNALAQWAKMAMPSTFKKIPSQEISLSNIQDAFQDIMKRRQQSAKEYAIQIKLSLTIKKGKINFKKLKDIIVQHSSYFKNSNNKKIKLRGSIKSKIINFVFNTNKLLKKRIYQILDESSKSQAFNNKSTVGLNNEVPSVNNKSDFLTSKKSSTIVRPLDNNHKETSKLFEDELILSKSLDNIKEKVKGSINISSLKTKNNINLSQDELILSKSLDNIKEKVKGSINISSLKTKNNINLSQDELILSKSLDNIKENIKNHFYDKEEGAYKKKDYLKVEKELSQVILEGKDSLLNKRKLNEILGNGMLNVEQQVLVLKKVLDLHFKDVATENDMPLKGNVAIKTLLFDKISELQEKKVIFNKKGKTSDSRGI